jgi:hypothetical protein
MQMVDDSLSRAAGEGCEIFAEKLARGGKVCNAREQKDNRAQEILAAVAE